MQHALGSASKLKSSNSKSAGVLIRARGAVPVPSVRAPSGPAVRTQFTVTKLSPGRAARPPPSPAPLRAEKPGRGWEGLRCAALLFMVLLWDAPRAFGATGRREGVRRAGHERVLGPLCGSCLWAFVGLQTGSGTNVGLILDE